MSTPQTAMFLSSEKLQIIRGVVSGGKVLIQGALELDVDPGAVINGMITDPMVVRSLLDRLQGWDMRKLRLVVDSGLVLVKSAAVPKLNQKQLMAFTERELSDFSSSYEDLVYDYSVLDGGQGSGGGRILCCAAERKLIGGYQELFQGTSARLLSVDFSVNAACKLTGIMPELAGKTYILSVLDGSNMVSMLFERNQYIFSSRFRLFSERGTPGFFTELAEKVSSLIQFNKSQKSENQIETAYFCGLRENEIPVCGDISRQFMIETGVFPNSAAVQANLPDNAEFRLANLLFAVGCLIRK